MSASNKQASAQLGTYVTMIVGLLFLFLVVSQAGKYAKDGIVMTNLNERAAQTPPSGREQELLNDRERTMLRIGAVPVQPVQQLAGMPGRPASQNGNSSATNVPQQPMRQTTGRPPQDDLTHLQHLQQQALGNPDRNRTQPTQQAQPTQPIQPGQPTEVAQPTPGAGKRQYTVRANETLYSISLKVYGNGNRWNDILKANPDMNPHKIAPGMKIVIPEPAQPSAAYRRWATGNEG